MTDRQAHNARDTCPRCRAPLAPLERRLGYCVDCATHPDVTDPDPMRQR